MIEDDFNSLLEDETHRRHISLNDPDRDFVHSYMFLLSTANLSTNCSGDLLHFQDSAQSGRERRQNAALLRV